MNTMENISLNVHKLDQNECILSSVRYENNSYNQHLMVKLPLTGKSFDISGPSTDNTKIYLSCRNFDCGDVTNEYLVTLFKLDDFLNYDKLNDSNESADSKGPFGNLFKKNYNVLNVPTMIRCQNCETNFPTKYQYQRHQCEFNAEKVVLKPDAEINDIEKGMRVKYNCNVCNKQFVSKNNLERHRISHDSTQDNTCEYCNKQFVSENRLRIHKENHCKKAGDISKFYRSDVAVWKCTKCHEVFSSLLTANFHTENCTELITEISSSEGNVPDISLTNHLMHQSLFNEREDNLNIKTENRNVDKIMTEILLQCEFCNRTYADKNVLLLHQRKHTTERNYQCVNCNESFDSYGVAAQHWLKKCSERANLFYLPKLTYCEYCDRTFKSHEILYTHKIKKKHYTPKIHSIKTCEDEDKENSNMSNKGADARDVIDKLIEDVLITLDVPVNKIGNRCYVADKQVEKINEDNRDDENRANDAHNKDVSNELDNKDNVLQLIQEPEKRKRGRKKKWSKQILKGKRIVDCIPDGYIYQCERCIKVFFMVSDLENHREKEHAASFNCDECGQVLHSAKALLIHSRAHKSLKPYVCDTCGRSYSQTSHLWQHMRFHQGIKPFACPHEGCEARYTIRPDLKDHIRKVHTRERPFKCAVCNKCFLTGSVYYQHRLIHTNDRRYGCDVCCKRFFRADALNNHKRIHTDERPYPCGVCGREFRQKGDRNKHVRTQHPDTILN